MDIAVQTAHRVVVVNGEAIPFAPDMSGRNITVDKWGITIDGYRFQDGAWVKREKREKRKDKAKPGVYDLLRDLLFG